MLTALPYLHLTTSYFKQQKQVWDFFASYNHKAEQLKDFKIDLLKNTYKFDKEADASLYAMTEKAKEKLGLTIDVSVYQTQNSDDINASIIYIDNHAHIVFSGKLIQVLSEDELLAVIGHELAHVQLYLQVNGEVEVADRIVTAIANSQGSTPAHYETARLFKLYTEIFCDRGSYLVTGDYKPIITSLVKLATGLQTVNPDSYIKQAEEVFSIDQTIKAASISHPENFIRARAMWLWHKSGHDSNNTIRQMIEGNIGMDELDLFHQQQISLYTTDLIKAILFPAWMQTAQTISLAKQYNPEIGFLSLPDKTVLAGGIENVHDNLKDYLAYVLYDFATADKLLEDVPLAHCFALADELKLEIPFANAVKRERKITDKKVSLLKKKCLAELQNSETVSDTQ